MGNSPDGAAFPSNLFGITPLSDVPASHFLSISLERPGSNKVPSALGIGRHPSEVVTDPSAIMYSNIVSDPPGDLFWKSNVKAITVYVNGVPKPITLGASATGGPFLTATLDTGVPFILTTTSVANGIYGALGISPANDGQCKLSFISTHPFNLELTMYTYRLCPMYDSPQHDHHP
jgi:hypothetical protein